ncbi:hypothetical protein D3C79_1002690 [compost metagenome]
MDVDQRFRRHRQRGELGLVPLRFAAWRFDNRGFATGFQLRQAVAVIPLAVAQQHRQAEFIHGGFNHRAPFAIAYRHAIDHWHLQAA